MAQNRDIVEAFSEMSTHYETTVDAELRRFWGWSYEGFISQLLDLMPVKDEDTVLDIATGTGVIPVSLKQRGKQGGKIVGLDLTPAMLYRAARKISGGGWDDSIVLTCASAMQLPYRESSFDVVFCALATHHLDVPVLMSEIKRVLKPGGQFAIADVGGSAAWRAPVVNALIRAATFLYFLPREGRARASAEAAALNNVFTGKEWGLLLEELNFRDVSITHLPASHFWSPTPFVIRAEKDSTE